MMIWACLTISKDLLTFWVLVLKIPSCSSRTVSEIGLDDMRSREIIPKMSDAARASTHLGTSTLHSLPIVWGS